MVQAVSETLTREYGAGHEVAPSSCLSTAGQVPSPRRVAPHGHALATQLAVIAHAPVVSTRLKPVVHDVGPERVGVEHDSLGHTLGQPLGQVFMVTSGHCASVGAQLPQEQATGHDAVFSMFVPLAQSLQSVAGFVTGEPSPQVG